MEKDKQNQASKAMKKSGARKVLARLSRRANNTIKQFTKQAQNMVDNVEVGSRSFPDKSTRQAVRNLLDSIENNLESLLVIAQAEGDDETVEIVEEMICPAEGHEDVDDVESDLGPDHQEGGEVDVDGLEVDLGDAPLDETAMHGYAQ